MDAEYEALLMSRRVNTRLRDALLGRAASDEPGYLPQSLDTAAFATLRAAVARVLPHDIEGLDLAARIDARLASGGGDGWRFADLPSDAEAYKLALSTLNGRALRQGGSDFAAIAPDAQDRLLGEVAAKAAVSSNEGLDADRMAKWFEDLRGEVVKTYLAHPDALDRIGFSGIGAGGDDVVTGFRETSIGAREPWEPASPTGVSL